MKEEDYSVKDEKIENFLAGIFDLLLLRRFLKNMEAQGEFISSEFL
jgi:hypothetical protein